jgi:hypothetical protein
MRLLWEEAHRSLTGEAVGVLDGFNGRKLCSERTEQDREQDALERYYERRLAEIAAGEPLSDHFVSVEVLQELSRAPSGF